MGNYAAETERVLRDAGWTPGRSVDVAALRRRMEELGFVVSEAAERFLSEFGGLVFDIRGPGINVARECFELNPLLAEGQADIFEAWSETLGEQLTPIGLLDHRHWLAISESGGIYLAGDWLASYGSVPQALESLILGVKARVVAY